MKNNYILTIKIVIGFFTLSLLTLLNLNGFSQSRVAFKPRTSQKAPDKYKGVSTYNLQGDFTMVGNTNLTLGTYSVNSDNSNNQMIYVDVDGDANTFNSSSATFNHNLDATCTKVIYAGLYWTGRADDANQNTFNVTKNGVTKLFDKRKVKFKKAGGTYQDITAAATDIYYPTNTDGNMYSAYADVTDYVIAQGVGNYFVGDIALTEGNGGSAGYYGGWGLVIIYENPSLKWRDITVFDGHGYIAGSIGAQELDVSGFQAVKNGPVNVKMGMMAGEGDRNIAGDYFNIRNAADNLWVGLSHSGNTVGNFFNSSIVTGGNARNPNLVNNTGLDVSMFDLTNTNNSIIKNNQTSTKFQYGSTQDTYVIFNIVFAVDAYIPEVQVFNANVSSVPNGGTVDPNQNIEFTSTIYNKGTEPISNGVVEIPIPFNAHYVSSNVTVGSGSVTWSHPSGATDPNVTPGGVLKWTVGNLIKPTDPNTILAQLKYSIRVTNDCTILKTGGACGLSISLDGTFTGTGTNSGIPINNGFVIGYNSDCGNTPIRDPFTLTIVPSQAFLNACPNDVINGSKQFKAFCSVVNNVIPRATITSSYPAGTKFYTQQPGTAGYLATEVTVNFAVNPSGIATKYYAVLSGMPIGCYLSLETVVEIVSTQPTAANIQYCVGSPIPLNVQLSSVGSTKGYQLYYFDNNSTTPLANPPAPTAAGIYTYQVAEGATQNNVTCYGPKVTFTIEVYAMPIITQNLTDFSVCADNIQTLVIQSNASQVSWEYFNTTTSAWTTLTAATFQNQLVPSGSTLTIDNPSIDIDQLKIRAKLTSANSCVMYSAEAIMDVRLCNIITNPMLPAKIIKN